MAKAEITLQNFSGGELSPKMYGRYLLPIYNNGCKRLENFISQTQGPALYRPGTKFVLHTRGNKVANLIKFEFNDVQAYQLEFTDKKLRIYRNEAIITEDSKTISLITRANPGVVSCIAHGYSDGDEVFIESVVGMTQVNGKSYIVANSTANSFELTDVDGVNVNTSGFTAYSSGGVCKRIFEVVTPYAETSDLFRLKVTQNADTMYIVHPFYEPRKLTRTGHTAWTLVRYTRTADPFLEKKVISGITNANPGVVTATSHGFEDGDTVIIEEVVGMTEVNSQPYIVANKTASTFELTDLSGNNVDTRNFGTYSSVGFASKAGLLPSTTAFYESRLWFAGMDLAPDRFHGSRAPQGAGDPSPGDPRYDDFTAGTDDDHAVEFTIADEEVNKIRWLKGTDRLMIAGTFGAEDKITGETAEKPITPTSVNVRAENRLGVADIAPINKENIVIYVQRGKRTLRSFEFDALSDSFTSVDRNLVSEHITEGNFKQIAWQSGRPDILWAVKDNGELIGLTFKSREDVSGWHRHRTFALSDKFLSVSTTPRPSGFDQIWFVIERTVNGKVRRYVEFLADIMDLPEPLDYFTGVNNEASDMAVFQRAMAEAQKEYIYLDSSLTYDGTSVGTVAGATMTPGAVSGSSVTFTASAAVFASTDVDRQIWKKAIDGVGYGRAKITAFISTTQVTCQILEDFDNVNAIAAGSWYLTTDSLLNLEHLEGRTVSIVADGGPHPDKVISGGALTLDYQVSKVHIGLGYTGLIQPLSIEVAGTTGPSQPKSKNVYKVGIKFDRTLGAEFGTDIYDPEEISFTDMPVVVGRPPLPFSGVKFLPYTDNWERDKFVYIRQSKPLPCMVLLLAIYAEGDND